jgi:hypothetical protein
MEENKVLTLKWKDKEIKHGQKITASIANDKPVECRLSILNDNKFYLCQNYKKGEYCNDTFEYAFSWTFNKRNKDDFTDNILIHEVFDDIYIPKDGFIYSTGVNEKEFCIMAKEYKEKSLVSKISFSIQNYPSCCGSNIIHYIKYSGCNDKFLKKVKNKLIENYINLTAILIKEQKEVFEKMDFKQINSFINTNSGNRLYMYAWNRKD